MPECIDLRERFGTTYRIRHDEAADHEPGGRSDPWLLTIPCQYGEIYPQGGNLLAFASKSRGGIAKAVAAIPGAEVLQDGDDGLNVAFPVERFGQVAELVKPRRRRHLSDEHKARLIAASAGHRFQPGHGSGACKTGLECVRTTSDVV